MIESNGETKLKNKDLPVAETLDILVEGLADIAAKQDIIIEQLAEIEEKLLNLSLDTGGFSYAQE